MKAIEKVKTTGKKVGDFVKENWLMLMIGTGAVIGTGLKIKSTNTNCYCKKVKAEAEAEAIRNRVDNNEDCIIYQDADIKITKQPY